MFRIIGLILALMLQLLIFLPGISTAAPVAGSTMTEKVTGMEFVWVPEGCFQPGNLSGTTATVPSTKKSKSGSQIRVEPDTIDRSKMICIRHGFWMAKYEVTQGQYQNIMGVNPSRFKKGDNYPVEEVPWLDVRKFIKRLNGVSSKHFSLPSEAQWEYAARSGGKNQVYGAGNHAGKAAWYMSNSRSTSHPVGQKLANALGIYDMSGNVWEWTADCWNEALANMPKDGSANKSGNCAARVLRGGSWYDAKEMIKTTSRLWNDTDKFDNNSGFRLVLH